MSLQIYAIWMASSLVGTRISAVLAALYPEAY